jgi:hypothetical protein
MSSSLSYVYQGPSVLVQNQAGQEELQLTQFSEIQKSNETCFFWGTIKEPYILSRCLIALSKTVESSFNMSPYEWSQQKDPIVTAGANKVRFEGFSGCAGVYARVDVLEDGHKGEFPAIGTTNVDFNSPMITELARTTPKDELVLSVGKKEVAIYRDGQSTVERKVPLPTKWIKGLTTVQHYFAYSSTYFKLNKIQALGFIRSVPKGKSAQDHYIIKRGTKVLLSPMKTANAIVVGGSQRLKLLEPLIPHINEMTIYAEHGAQAISIILHFNTINFIFSISRDAKRGFSGEGAVLQDLLEDVPDQLIKNFDNLSYANQTFNPTLLGADYNLDSRSIETLSAQLAAMGMLGFDLKGNEFFYRRLPFKLKRIMSLNPRLKGVEKLLEEKKVEILRNDGIHVEARVDGTGAKHYVSLGPAGDKCTCLWYSQNQGERGHCKHILATKKLANAN